MIFFRVFNHKFYTNIKKMIGFIKNKKGKNYEKLVEKMKNVNKLWSLACLYYIFYDFLRP